MTQTLQKVIKEIEDLSETEQEALAMLIQDELLWDLSLKDSQSSLEILANEALTEFKNGKTQPLEL
jgi:hypothetical protein